MQARFARRAPPRSSPWPWPACWAAHALAQVDVSNAWVRGTVPAQSASGAFMTLHAHESAKLVGGVVARGRRRAA